MRWNDSTFLSFGFHSHMVVVSAAMIKQLAHMQQQARDSISTVLHCTTPRSLNIVLFGFLGWHEISLSYFDTFSGCAQKQADDKHTILSCVQRLSTQACLPSAWHFRSLCCLCVA